MLDKRTKSAFLSKARHNLKNPVNAILGYSEMLIEDCEEHNIKIEVGSLKKLNKAGKKILMQIESSLKISGNDNLNKSVLEMGREIESAIKNPLNTILEVSMSLLNENEILNKIDHFKSDIDKILKSASLLEIELESIIHFNSFETDDLRKKDLNSGHFSMVKDVIQSIEPLGPDEKQVKVTGNILVVDDNPNNTELLKKRLSRKGHSVSVANNGQDSLIQLMQNVNHFDVLLLDIIMPEMNGYEVLKFIRNDKRFFDLPVIMVSSMDDTDSIYRCIEMGADDYIQKPFVQSILDARISTCIEKKQLRDKEKQLLKDIEIERERSETILYNVLPDEIAYRLKSGEVHIADKHEMVSVMFADIIDFSPQVKDLNPLNVVTILNKVFSEFDLLAKKLGIEKIKTIGDSYFAVGGLKGDPIKSALNTISLAREMNKVCKIINEEITEMIIDLRVGIHSGEAISGVIGKTKYTYDLWGSTINLANRLETTCPVGKIQISEETKKLIGSKFQLDSHTKDIKGFGEINTFTLDL